MSLDPLERLPGALGEDLVESLAQEDDLLGLDLDVDRLAAGAAQRLVEHDAGVQGGRARRPEDVASRNAAAEAAMPTQTVLTLLFIRCITS